VKREQHLKELALSLLNYLYDDMIRICQSISSPTIVLSPLENATIDDCLVIRGGLDFKNDSFMKKFYLERKTQILVWHDQEITRWPRSVRGVL
jgi:hypothetical protein